MKTPYLVQRCKLRHHIGDKTLMGSFVSYDYMGSSEFEWGAIPRALRAMRLQIMADHNSYSVREVKSGNKKLHALRDYDGAALHVLAPVTISDDELFDAMSGLAQNKTRCKEWHGLDYFYKAKLGLLDCKPLADLWFDIENRIWFCFQPIVLELIKANLTRHVKLDPIDFSNMFSIGDVVEIANIPGAKAIGDYHDINQSSFNKVTGTVCGVADSMVTVKSHGKRYRVWWWQVITSPAASIPLFDDVDMKDFLNNSDISPLAFRELTGKDYFNYVS